MRIGTPIARRIWAFCAGVFILAAAAASAVAGTTGAIQGYITDTSGHPLAGVAVSASSPSGHFSTATGANGFYSLNGLPLDTYTLVFTKDGYQTAIVRGVTTTQDIVNRISVHLQNGALKSLGKITVRSNISLVQPTVTADVYVVNQNRLSDLNGTPQDLNGFAAFNSLPGVTTDNVGYPTIRAGAENDVGYELDGVDNTEIGTGEFLNALTLNGARSVQLSTGGYDVSNGNTNSGVINEVVKRGTYPPEGQATARMDGPTYGHELSFDWGAADPQDRFSYYLSFGGARDASDYGDRHTLLPLQLGNTVFTSLNDDIVNLFYHFGRHNDNEIQYLANISAETFDFNYLASPAVAPYPSNNGNVWSASDPFGACLDASGNIIPSCYSPLFQSNYFTLFPGQSAIRQNTNQADTQTFNSVIQKFNYKRQITPSSFVEARVFKNYLNWVDWYAYNVGSFSDSFFNEQTQELGEAFDYTNQLSSKNELRLGGEHGAYTDNIYTAFPSFEPTYEPLEDLGCPQVASVIFNDFTGTNVPGYGGCYIAPYNAAINNSGLASGPLPTDPAHAPMQTYANDSYFSDAPVHKWDAWIEDRWQPNERFTLTYGLRWDQEVLGFPADVSQQDTTWYINDTQPAGCTTVYPPSPGQQLCDLVTLPGPSIGADVTRPQQLSPRMAASYELSPIDTLRMSYGKNIEFVPVQALQSTYNAVPTSLQRCTVANGCLLPLPGYGVTNHISNLYQQTIIDLTTNDFAQYTPVLPQTAINYDFSWEHDFGAGLQLRITPYYRKGFNYVVGNQPLLFTLPSGTPVFGPPKEENAGINENTGLEFALQRDVQYGFSGLLDATYDNTLANYDGDFFPTVNAAAIAANHFFHITYVAPVTGTLNLVYNTRGGWHASTTINYESGYRYGVGKKKFIFGANGKPREVLNTDIVSATSEAYYFTNPNNPGTAQQPNIIASRGTSEGDDPGTLFGPAIATVNLTVSHTIGAGLHNSQVGLRVLNLLGNYSPSNIVSNPYYVPAGPSGGAGPGSGFNFNQCAPHQTYACEPFMYNYSPFPYEIEPDGPPRMYTLFYSIKY
jgi:hypothetical protein